MTKKQIQQFQDALLSWYNQHARVLPFRENPTPYRVWISEIMLQQTRMDTVLPYYERFIGEIPDVVALAEVSDERLLKLWEGLGYYSRARNLKKAAQIIIKDYEGQVPDDVKSLRTLPGIGPYTAGAIASIAFGKRAEAIDGNVLRVMARVTAEKGDISQKSVHNRLETVVRPLVDTPRVGDFNQALMELGALICIPSETPKCGLCPVSSLCKAYDLGIQGSLPVKTSPKSRKIEKKTVLVMRYGDQFALRKRTEKGVLCGLWELPSLPGHCTTEECVRELSKQGVFAAEIIPLSSSKHIFSHLEWHMIGYCIVAERVENRENFVWKSADEIKAHYSIPAAFKEYMKFLNESMQNP